MASSVRGANALRRTLQRMAKEDGPVVEPVKTALKRGAERLYDQIQYNIVAADLVDEGDLLDSVAITRRSNGFVWRVGLFRTGAIRKWRLAGWRGHFAEFGTENQPARPFLWPAARAVLPGIIDDVDRAVGAALERIRPAEEVR